MDISHILVPQVQVHEGSLNYNLAKGEVDSLTLEGPMENPQLVALGVSPSLKGFGNCITGGHISEGLYCYYCADLNVSKNLQSYNKKMS